MRKRIIRASLIVGLIVVVEFSLISFVSWKWESITKVAIGGNRIYVTIADGAFSSGVYSLSPENTGFFIRCELNPRDEIDRRNYNYRGMWLLRTPHGTANDYGVVVPIWFIFFIMIITAYVVSYITRVS